MSKYADFIISCIHRDLLSLFHHNLIFTAMYTFWHECTFKMCAFIKKMCLNKCLWHIYDYMNYIVAFWKIYLATSITGVFGAWSNQNCSVSETQKYDGFITCFVIGCITKQKWPTRSFNCHVDWMWNIYAGIGAYNYHVFILQVSLFHTIFCHFNF